jgi:hypothetical protein
MRVNDRFKVTRGSGYRTDAGVDDDECRGRAAGPARHNLFVQRVTGILGELDERLAALDGKRSITD